MAHSLTVVHRVPSRTNPWDGAVDGEDTASAGVDRDAFRTGDNSVVVVGTGILAVEGASVASVHRDVEVVAVGNADRTSTRGADRPVRVVAGIHFWNTGIRDRRVASTVAVVTVVVAVDGCAGVILASVCVVTVLLACCSRRCRWCWHSQCYCWH